MRRLILYLLLIFAMAMVVADSMGGRS